MNPALNERRNMAASQLLTNKVTDLRILEAMLAVPREEFVPALLRHSAYVDEDLNVGNGRFLMAPMTFARLLELAAITPACRALIVGCLTGYTAAVVALLAGHVVAVDTDAALLEQAVANFSALGITDVDVEQVETLANGYGKSAPYDVIVIPAAVDFIPGVLGEQLSLSGRLVTVKNLEKRPGMVGGAGRGMLVKRIHSQLQYREHFDAASAVLPGFEQPKGFSF